MADEHDELEKKLEDPEATPMPLPYCFLKAITTDFSEKLKLGAGSFGVVYKGVLRSGKIIAVKNFRQPKANEQMIRKEAKYLMKLKHPNIVKLIGYCSEVNGELAPNKNKEFTWDEISRGLLCFEYACHGSLQDVMGISDKYFHSDWHMRYKLIHGICTGLRFLHEEHGMVHLDLKPDNILVNGVAMIPIISDFGLSETCGEEPRIIEEKTKRHGTVGYMAPEYSEDRILSRKADIYSLGVIMAEIITGHRFPYPMQYTESGSPDISDEKVQLGIQEEVQIWRDKIPRTPDYEPVEKYTHQVQECITIALKCLNPSNTTRPTVDNVIELLNAIDQSWPGGPIRRRHPRLEEYAKKFAKETRDSDFFTKKIKVVTGAIEQCYGGARMTIVFEDVYRNAYDTVLNKHGDALYKEVKSAMFTEVKDLGSSLDGTVDSMTLFLNELLERWVWHMRAVLLIRDIVMYMDRTYVPVRNVKPIYELGLELWRDNVVYSHEVETRLIVAMKQEKGGNEATVMAVPGNLIASVTDMLKELGDDVYHRVMHGAANK